MHIQTKICDEQQTLHRFRSICAMVVKVFSDERWHISMMSDPPTEEESKHKSYPKMYDASNAAVRNIYFIFTRLEVMKFLRFNEDWQYHWALIRRIQRGQ